MAYSNFVILPHYIDVRSMISSLVRLVSVSTNDRRLDCGTRQGAAAGARQRWYSFAPAFYLCAVQTDSPFNQHPVPGYWCKVPTKEKASAMDHHGQSTSSTVCLKQRHSQKKPLISKARSIKAPWK
ncbi:uncharacterized protein LOC121599072 [Anopheles merus]|uniref:uncharacterized protein LOC121599072 n=1 Tax=Anopheles merus TaxID=30066 RepID=UPI001BE4D497|nr:uncharacterized protein LOC121599072 [Anopheles merus]